MSEQRERIILQSDERKTKPVVPPPGGTGLFLLDDPKSRIMSEQREQIILHLP